MLIDTHAHLYNEYYDNIDDVINKSKELGVDIIITSAIDIPSINETISVTSKYNNVYGTIGIHPEKQDEFKDSDLDVIEKHIHDNNIVAIGEIGLDYHYEDYDKERQIFIFEKQLALAEKYNVPVVVHSRDAINDTLNCIKKYKVTGVIHSFSGSVEMGREFIKYGFLLGVNGVVTFKNAKYIDVVKTLGIENYILETDSPYLTPEPFRGKKNIPGYTFYVAKFLSDNLNIDIDKIMEITSVNACRIFDIKK